MRRQMKKGFTLKHLTPLALALMLALLGSAVGVTVTQAVGPQIRSIPLSGTGSPQLGDATPSGSGDVTQVEFAGETEGGSGISAYAGNIVNRSLSKGTGNGVFVNTGQKAKSN